MSAFAPRKHVLSRSERRLSRSMTGKAWSSMRVVALTAYIVQLPLRREIKHASATRRESANLLIRCRLSDGTEGWGEGVPRSYVTGETPQGAAAAARRHAAAPNNSGAIMRHVAGRDSIVRASFSRAIGQPDPRGHGANALALRRRAEHPGRLWPQLWPARQRAGPPLRAGASGATPRRIASPLLDHPHRRRARCGNASAR
jgi:hypothetical protein